MQQKRWTSDEMELLRVFYPHSFTESLSRILSGRSMKTIRQKANFMQLKKTEKCMQMHHVLSRPRFEYGKTRINKYEYIEVLIDGKWQRLSWLIYEQHYGPIPHGYNVTYADGNRKNLSPKNLRLISRKEALQQVSFSSFPKEIRDLMLISNQIRKEINDTKKQ